MKYRPTIGLEVHVELKTNSKMFCSCKNDLKETKPNINVCPVCMAHPGTLPTMNEDAIRRVIKVGLAMGCDINQSTYFERKNYFYPDLPKGYQISQYAYPLCKDGHLYVNESKIKIERIHLEEDTARLVHDGKDTLVDFNRAGVPLMELVTDPDFDNAEDAQKFAQELQLILRYLDVSNADMERGQMRVEANISISATRKLGTKVEIKNLNSFKVVGKAIEYEIKRQTEVLDSGEEVVQATRGWDDKKQITVAQRTKEEAHDYRYFPEPDLPPLDLSDKLIEEIKLEVTELPDQKRVRFKDQFNIKDEDIETFVLNRDLSEFYEKVVSEFKEWSGKDDLGQITANYITSDLLGLMKAKTFSEDDLKITPENFAEFINLVHSKEVNSKIAKTVLLEMFKTGKDPSDIIKDEGLSKMDDASELDVVVQKVIDDNSKAIDDYKKGKGGALQFLIGKVMAQTKGRANPEILEEIFTKLIK
jgi:aspartyl-tRNA(Asn)/glutamyl-tRNA(Gln) amidotransferase subunit B